MNISAIVAFLMVSAAQVYIAVLSYWYLYGMWPSSWWAYAGFTAVLAALSVLSKAIEKEL